MRQRRSSYSSSRNKKSGFLSIFLFIFLITASVGYAAYTQITLMNAKKEYNMLVEKINVSEKDIIHIESNIENINSTIGDKNSEYKKVYGDAKIAYLTFDDGPSKNTEAILDILDRYDIKATFFVNGHEGLEHLYKEISDRGHVIANHTYSHDYKEVYSSIDNFKASVNKLNDFIKEATGKEPAKILRYPGGSNNQVSWNYSGKGFMKELVKEMKSEGYVFFDWNLDSSDANAYRQKKSKIISSILNNAKYVTKANILMHDLGPKTTTVEALPEVIEGLLKQGFIFDSLSAESYKHQFTKID